jgi:hypothetical protein
MHVRPQPHTPGLGGAGVYTGRSALVRDLLSGLGPSLAAPERGL